MANPHWGCLWLPRPFSQFRIRIAKAEPIDSSGGDGDRHRLAMAWYLSSMAQWHKDQFLFVVFSSVGSNSSGMFHGPSYSGSSPKASAIAMLGSSWHLATSPWWVRWRLLFPLLLVTKAATNEKAPNQPYGCIEKTSRYLLYVCAYVCIVRINQ